MSWQLCFFPTLQLFSNYEAIKIISNKEPDYLEFGYGRRVISKIESSNWRS